MKLLEPRRRGADSEGDYVQELLQKFVNNCADINPYPANVKNMVSS
jgi:hypothetical protein